MAEFKPRSSEGGDDSEDKEGSFVQNWLEKMVGDDESDTQESDVDTKKKKRFGKLFKPVFRMLFPRNENAVGAEEEAPKKSIFGANILGISKEVDPDEETSLTHAPEEPNNSTVSISHEETPTDIAEHNLPSNELVPTDNEAKDDVKPHALNIPEEATRDTAINKTERLQEIAHVSPVGVSESSLGYSESVNNIEKNPQKNEVKRSKEPSVLSFIASEFSARRHRRKQEKAQKKLEKRQKQIEIEAKNTKLGLQANSKKIHETVKREIKREIPKYVHENKVMLNRKETAPTQKAELVVVKEIQSEKQEEVQAKKVERSPLTNMVERKEIEKRELEKLEIERIINAPSTEIEKEEKTERYFETRQEVKDASQTGDRAKYYSKPSQNREHDPYYIQSKIGIPVNRVATNEKMQSTNSNAPRQTSQQVATDPGKIVGVVMLGIICALIIIKFFLV